MSVTATRPNPLLAWSSGKDSAWSLHVLRQQNELEIVGLLTTINQAFDLVATHAVRAGSGVSRLHVTDEGKGEEQRLFSRVSTLDDQLPADQPQKVALLAEILQLIDSQLRHPDALDGGTVKRARTALAVALCSFTTVVGYWSLLFSANKGIRSFGLAAMSGEVTCLAAALLSAATLQMLCSVLRSQSASPSPAALVDNVAVGSIAGQRLLFARRPPYGLGGFSVPPGEGDSGGAKTGDLREHDVCTCL